MKKSDPTPTSTEIITKRGDGIALLNLNRPKSKRSMKVDIKAKIRAQWDDVRKLLDDGRGYQDVAKVLALPVSSAGEVRYAATSLGLRRRRRFDVKHDLLAGHHALISERLNGGVAYIEIVKEIGHPQLHVPDLARYVSVTGLPRRPRGITRGFKHIDLAESEERAAFIAKAIDQGETLESVGDKINLTKEAVRQLLIKAGHPSQSQLIARNRLRVLPVVLSLLRKGLQHDSIALIWNNSHPPDEAITMGFVTGLFVAAKSNYYERLNERLAIRESFDVKARANWETLPELIKFMESIRKLVAKRSTRKRKSVDEADQRLVAQQRREAIIQYVKDRPKVNMTTMARSSDMDREAVNGFLYGSGAPTNDEWDRLCAAYPGLASLGHVMRTDQLSHDATSQ